MVFRALKFSWRRYRLAQNNIIQQCNVPTFTAGARSGVWTVSSEGLGPESIVYSFGVGDNIAWELALIEKYGLTVHAFDPTPACVAWIAQQRLPNKFHFHPIGIAAHDGFCTFHLPRRGSRFNYIPAPADALNVQQVEMPVKRLATLMVELGHRQIDVLKMDIEGGEFAVLDDLLVAGIPAKQILVEFHHHFRGVGLGATVRAIRALNDAGYRIFDISDRGLEIALLRTSRPTGQ